MEISMEKYKTFKKKFYFRLKQLLLKKLRFFLEFTGNVVKLNAFGGLALYQEGCADQECLVRI
jgi:hypothetical protein